MSGENTTDITFADFSKAIEGDRAVVQFVSSWDPASKIFAPIFQRFQKTYPTIKFIRINVDKSPKIAQVLKIKAVPTFVAYKRGEVLKKFSGALEGDLLKVCEDLSAF
jgi:thioredoxin-like negative regulator of GroEL